VLEAFRLQAAPQIGENFVRHPSCPRGCVDELAVIGDRISDRHSDQAEFFNIIDVKRT
jgi:hypothetical protein